MQKNARRRPSRIAMLLASMARVLFATLLFTAGGMGVGLLLGIIGMIFYGLISGVQPDMRNAYRHVAIPVAIATGTVAFAGAIVLELRASRTRTLRP